MFSKMGRQIHGDFLPVLGLLFFLLQGEIFTVETVDDQMCDVVRVIEFKSARLIHYKIIQTYCNMGKVECFFKCLNETKCRSFVVLMRENCTGTTCVLYQWSQINDNHFAEDDNSSYYFMSSPCCNGSCLYGGLCRSKRCNCACQKGYTSTKCICPSHNLTRRFSHEWKTVSDSMSQIDSGVQTWAVKTNDWSIWTLQNGNWIQIDGGLTHVTSGKSGVWGVNGNDYIYYRYGVTNSSPHGTRWIQLHGRLTQIDSGSPGIVYGINKENHLFCRAGITDMSPYGTGWIYLPGYYKYVSCGDYGCWVIKTDLSISFRTGVTSKNCQGTGWIDVDRSFVQLEAGFNGRVYAVTSDNALFFRSGVCAVNPIGQNWKKIESISVRHVAVGDYSLYAIATNGNIFTTN